MPLCRTFANSGGLRVESGALKSLVSGRAFDTMAPVTMARTLAITEASKQRSFFRHGVAFISTTKGLRF